MVWVWWRRPAYSVGLTDGYMELPQRVIRQAEEQEKSMEKALAERICEKPIHDLTRHYRRRGVPESERNLLPTSVHVWVLGDSSWPSTQLASPARELAIHEPSPSYRIVIVGQEPGLCLRSTYWTQWMRETGLKRPKAHADMESIGPPCRRLLKQIYDHYIRTRQPPHCVLDSHGLPYIFEAYSSLRG